MDESIQTAPRKISHLKKEFIKGIAACKTTSACWSDKDVWTWGTNGGQLGEFTFADRPFGELIQAFSRI